MPWPLSAWAGTINKDGRRRRQWLKDLRISGLKMDLGNSRKSSDLNRESGAWVCFASQFSVWQFTTGSLERLSSLLNIDENLR